jgi:hypothetical protein
MALRADGEMPLPAKLMPSPLCGPARVSGGDYAKPFRKSQRKYPVPCLPLLIVSCRVLFFFFATSLLIEIINKTTVH